MHIHLIYLVWFQYWTDWLIWCLALAYMVNLKQESGSCTVI
jgi:hypothetical protein